MYEELIIYGCSGVLHVNYYLWCLINCNKKPFLARRLAGRLAGRLCLGDKDNMVVGELSQQEIVKIVDLYGVKRV